jgi:hypothetical protein
MNQSNKAFGIARLEPEDHIQPFVCGFGIGQAAKHDDRKRETAPAKLSHKLRPAHDRHEMVGDD